MLVKTTLTIEKHAGSKAKSSFNEITSKMIHFPAAFVTRRCRYGQI
jgi:hypothetical protein